MKKNIFFFIFHIFLQKNIFLVSEPHHVTLQKRDFDLFFPKNFYFTISEYTKVIYQIFFILPWKFQYKYFLFI